MNRYIEYLWYKLYNDSLTMYNIRKDLYGSDIEITEDDIVIFQMDEDYLKEIGKRPWE